MKTQPKLAISQPSTAEATVARLSVKSTPHNTKSMEMHNEIQNTLGSIVEPNDLRKPAHLPLTFPQSNTAQPGNRNRVRQDVAAEASQTTLRSRTESEAAQKRWQTYYPAPTLTEPYMSKISLRRC
jgi:hypothetical protein